jgi:hypothetical protein
VKWQGTYSGALAPLLAGALETRRPASSMEREPVARAGPPQGTHPRLGIGNLSALARATGAAALLAAPD